MRCLVMVVMVMAALALPAPAQSLIGPWPFVTGGCGVAGLYPQYNLTTRVFDCVSKYAELWFYTSSTGSPTPLGINIVSQYHGFGLTASGTTVSGWTYKGGVAGTVSSVADNGSGTILITTSAPHGLAAGDYVVQNGFTTRTTYQGKYLVLSTPLTTTYTVTRAFQTSTDTGWFQRSWSLRANTGSAGLYRVTFSLSAEADSNSTTFRWEVNRNATDMDNVASQFFYVSASRAANTAATGLISVSDNDVMYVSVKNLTDSSDWRLWLASLTMTRIN